MIYAISDLHGCYDLYLKMLEKIKFGDNDTLYILGDIVDRGEDGIKILLDAMKRRNVIVIQGNHDYMAYRILKNLIANDGGGDNISDMMQRWFFDGGNTTHDAFVELEDNDQRKILSYMNTFLIYDEVTVNGNTFFMSHTVPEKARMLEFEKLLPLEFIVGEPDYDMQYYDDKYIITGHTPTAFIEPGYSGKIWKKNNHIAIDCGAVFVKKLGCICLDTLEEFYVEG